MISLPSLNPTSFSRFVVHVSIYTVLSACGQARFKIVLSMLAEGALLDWSPIISHLCAVWLNGSVRVNNSRLKDRCSFFAFIYTYLPKLPNLYSIGSYLGYSKVRIQWTWLLSREESAYGKPTAEVIYSNFVLITDFFSRIQIFVIKSDVGSPVALLRLHEVRFRWIKLLSVIGSLDQSRVVVRQ